MDINEAYHLLKGDLRVTIKQLNFKTAEEVEKKHQNSKSISDYLYVAGAYAFERNYDKFLEYIKISKEKYEKATMKKNASQESKTQLNAIEIFLKYPKDAYQTLIASFTKQDMTIDLETMAKELFFNSKLKLLKKLYLDLYNSTKEITEYSVIITTKQYIISLYNLGNEKTRKEFEKKQNTIQTKIMEKPGYKFGWTLEQKLTQRQDT